MSSNGGNDYDYEYDEYDDEYDEYDLDHSDGIDNGRYDHHDNEYHDGEEKCEYFSRIDD
jgi:hypothetical protein